VIFFYFGLFIIIFWEMNPAKSFFFKFVPFESHQSSWCDLWRSCASAHDATRLHSVTPKRRWLSHAIWHGVTPFTLNELAWLAHQQSHWPSFSFLLLSFFLPLSLSTLRWLHWWFQLSLPYSELVVPPIDSMRWYPNRVGYVRQLYRLILFYFQNFAWMNSCGRVWRLKQCNCD
jgi:hypothetical protein